MITLTQAAVLRLKELLTDKPTSFFRISVQAGGCSGFEYSFSIDEALTDEDQSFEQDGVKVVIDEVSLSLVDESVLDFKSDMMASKFELKNPQAKSGCGCGNSFSL